MSEFYQLEPEVAGEVGEGSVIDRGVRPPKVEYLEYIFTGWLGDCLVESYPVFLITQSAAAELTKNLLNGFRIREAQISMSPSILDLYPESDVPEFRWLEINGTAFKNDFGLKGNMLIVSRKSLEVLKAHGLKHCDMIGYKKKVKS